MVCTRYKIWDVIWAKTEHPHWERFLSISSSKTYTRKNFVAIHIKSIKCIATKKLSFASWLSHNVVRPYLKTKANNIYDRSNNVILVDCNFFCSQVVFGSGKVICNNLHDSAFSTRAVEHVMRYVFRSHLGTPLRQVDRSVLWNGACAVHPTDDYDDDARLCRNARYSRPGACPVYSAPST